jgi:hypothetical protein
VSAVTENVSRIKLDASLIIAGFVPESDFVKGGIYQRPFLAVVDEVTDVSGTQEYIKVEYEFAAIGSGQYTALSSLYRREQDAVSSLRRTLYKVYEANRLSENVPGVGKRYVATYVLYSDGHIEEMTDEGYDYLGKLYYKFGPQKIDGKDLLDKKEFFEPLRGKVRTTINRPPSPDSANSA